MKYKTYRINIWFDEETFKQFEVVAVDIESALADIREAYGPFVQYQYGIAS